LTRDTHKYARGSVLVVEADLGGAASLAGLAALRMGAGMVTLAGEGTTLPALALMRRTDAAAFPMLADPRLRSVVIGPGLGDEARGRDWLRRLIGGPRALVIDAGALGLLDGAPIGCPAVLTPHEGEFTRLFGPPGHDRVAAVRAAARAVDAVVLLKGAATIIAAPDGRAAINAHAAPWLATAGAGDVLAGMIGSLLAQGLAPFEAAQVAAWLHGEAGQQLGPGGIADDLVALLPTVLASL
jgi:ADP-dependent NAD(P)H-hydrate dehydratase / NAD(P)H-hydrate epimerase